MKNNAKPKSSDKVNDSSDDEVRNFLFRLKISYAKKSVVFFKVDDEALARKLHEEGLGVRPRSSKKVRKKFYFHSLSKHSIFVYF